MEENSELALSVDQSTSGVLKSPIITMNYPLVVNWRCTKVSDIAGLAHCWGDDIVSRFSMVYLIEPRSAATTSMSSGLGKILLGKVMSIANKTPPLREDQSLR